MNIVLLFKSLITLSSVFFIDKVVNRSETKAETALTVTTPADDGRRRQTAENELRSVGPNEVRFLHVRLNSTPDMGWEI